MGLVTATEVKAIMDNCTVADTVVDTCIIAADEVINNVFEDDIEITATLLKEIERWFTAHMIASVFDRPVSKERVGEVDVWYANVWKENLASTPYGQMVKQLDVSGKMANALGGIRAGVYAVKSFDSNNKNQPWYGH
jgi:hypothetical protein